VTLQARRPCIACRYKIMLDASRWTRRRPWHWTQGRSARHQHIPPPLPWPSSSIQLRRISPAPRSSIATANSYAPMSRPSRPPITVHWNHANPSPFGPGRDVFTHLFFVSDGSVTQGAERGIHSDVRSTCTLRKYALSGPAAHPLRVFSVGVSYGSWVTVFTVYS
jgi:hypothetical protein